MLCACGGDDEDDGGGLFCITLLRLPPNHLQFIAKLIMMQLCDWSLLEIRLSEKKKDVPITELSWLHHVPKLAILVFTGLEMEVGIL